MSGVGTGGRVSGSPSPGSGITGTAKKEKAPEFNPRWKGYVYIGLASLVNFAS